MYSVTLIITIIEIYRWILLLSEIKNIFLNARNPVFKKPESFPIYQFLLLLSKMIRISSRKYILSIEYSKVYRENKIKNLFLDTHIFHENQKKSNKIRISDIYEIFELMMRQIHLQHRYINLSLSFETSIFHFV